MKSVRQARSTEELADAFADLIEEGKGLLNDAVGKQARTTSTTLRDTLEDVASKIAGFQSSATKAARAGMDRGANAVRVTDDYVRDNPWPAVAGGLVLGALIASLFLYQRR